MTNFGFRKKWNRFVLCLMAFILFGCGQVKNEEKKNTDREPTVSSQETVEKELPTLLRIGVIDTGFSGEAIDSAYIAEGKNYVDESKGTKDTYGHGTAVASIIMNQAENGNFILVPLINAMYEKGKITAIDSDTLAVVIREAIDVFHCDMIHISGGVAQPNDSLKEAVDYAKEKNVIIVAAVGNDYMENPGARIYPAAYDSVISVGALDKDGTRAEFSQDWADEYVLGVDVTIRLMSGKEDMGSASSYAAAVYTASLIR